MARLDLQDSEPEFSVVRDDAYGWIRLRINADGNKIRLNVGKFHDDAEGLRDQLKQAVGQLDDLLKDWHDVPDDYDCYVTLDRGGYYVQVENKEAEGHPFPTREIAFYEAARLMAEMGSFPNAWLSGEHGPASEDCGEKIRNFHDEGGDKVDPLPGVQYADGQEVLFDGDTVEIIRDYGDLGIRFSYYGRGDTEFSTDREKFAPSQVPSEGTYILHYTSADGPGDDATWSVYKEQYVNADADEPIDGAGEHVSTHPTEAEARAEAQRLQEASNGT